MSDIKRQLQQNNEELAEMIESVNDMALHLQNLTVTENGTYTAGAGYDAIGQVVVAVESGPAIETCQIFYPSNASMHTYYLTVDPEQNNKIVQRYWNPSTGEQQPIVALKNSYLYLPLQDSSSIIGNMPQGVECAHISGSSSRNRGILVFISSEAENEITIPIKLDI